MTEVRIRSVALPGEHGGWSLTLEPVFLGLLVAASTSGVLLGLAALVAFVVRTPLRIVLVDLRRRRWLVRTRLAARLVLAEGAVLSGLVTGAVVVGNSPFWEPLAVALPLVIVAFGFDAFSRSRRLLPEVAGSVGIAAIAAAIALAGGSDMELAIGLWAVAAAHAIAAIGHVRVQVRRSKDMSPVRTEGDAAQIAAVLVAAVALAAGWTGLVAFGAIVSLTVAHTLLVGMAPVRVPILGAQQVVLGLAVVLTAGLGAVAP